MHKKLCRYIRNGMLLGAYLYVDNHTLTYECVEFHGVFEEQT